MIEACRSTAAPGTVNGDPRYRHHYLVALTDQAEELLERLRSLAPERSPQEILAMFLDGALRPYVAS